MGADQTADLTYVIPIRAAARQVQAIAELRAYLQTIAPICREVLVVDGSAPAVFAAHATAWGAYCRHVAPDPRYRYLNGKVNGVLTGADLARCAKVVVGDDDVRYTADDLARMAALLDHYDYVKPQNYFQPLPLHARVESARMLVNRAVVPTGDYPGTCGFRREVLQRIGPYDGDVLFENEEMFRHFALHGARMYCADDFFVRKLPPTLGKFLEQRPRQSYEDLGMRKKTVLFASLLPLGATLAARSPGLAAGYLALWSAAAVGLAWRGRAKDGAAHYFSRGAPLFAVPWIIERGISVWVALFWRVTRGGLPYWGRIVKGTGPAYARTERARRPRGGRAA